MAPKKKCTVCEKKENTFYSLDDTVFNRNISDILKNISGLEINNLDANKLLLCQACVVGFLQTESGVTNVRRLVRPKTPPSTPLKKQQTKTNNNNKKSEQAQNSESTHAPTIGTGNENSMLELRVMCELCKYAPISAKCFRNHMELRHKILNPRIFKCSICLETYIYINHYRKHMKKFHNIKLTLQQRRQSKYSIDVSVGAQNKSHKLNESKRLDDAVPSSNDNHQSNDIETVYIDDDDDDNSDSDCELQVIDNDIEQTQPSSTKKRKVNRGLFQDVTTETSLESDTDTSQRISLKRVLSEEILMPTDNDDDDDDEPIESANDSDVQIVDESEPNDVEMPAKQCVSLVKKAKKQKDHCNYDVGIEMPFSCDLCDYTNRSSKVFKRHLKTSHRMKRQKIYKCTKCSETYRRFNDLQEHIENVHNNELVPLVYGHHQSDVDMDEISTGNIILNDKHDTSDSDSVEIVSVNDRMVSTNDIIQCELCEYTTTWPKSLKQHIRKRHNITNTDTRPCYECPKCSEMHQTKDDLEHHMESVHEMDKPLEFLLAFFRHKYSSEEPFRTHVINTHNTLKAHLNELSSNEQKLKNDSL